jgi:L-2-hydroxyglutarate oxidase LhgO
VDYRRVAAALADEVRKAGGEILTGCRVTDIVRGDGEVVLETAAGSVGARRVVACAGLQSDRLSGDAASRVRIVPFRGDYYVLREEAQHLVRGLIYPVPDPRFPFLGVHFSRRMDGKVLAGPNAVLAFAREGYGRFRVALRDDWSTFSWPGFWRLASRHWRTGIAELWRDYSKRAYLARLRRYLPDLSLRDLLPGPCGIRAQAVARDGALVDDFLFRRDGPVTHVVNAPSPAATSSLAIARAIADALPA